MSGELKDVLEVQLPWSSFKLREKGHVFVPCVLGFLRSDWDKEQKELRNDALVIPGTASLKKDLSILSHTHSYSRSRDMP